MSTDRTTYIGSSDVAAILGVSPWKSAFLLYQEKIGAHVEEITPAKQKLFDAGIAGNRSSWRCWSTSCASVAMR